MNWAVIGAAALTLTIGCTARSGKDDTGNGEAAAAQAETPSPSPAVPAQPPSGWLLPDDAVAALLARETLVFEHARMSGPYPRDVVMVGFAPGSPLAARAAAVRLVDGSVAGGDGVHYYVRVRLDCPGDVPVWCAVDRLTSLGQVSSAAPLDMGYGPLQDR